MTWLIIGAVAFIIVWTNQRLRGLVILCCLIFMVGAAGRSLLHTERCGGTEDCLVDLGPTWSGFCFPTNGGAVLKTDGHYFLTSSAGASGGASCVDIRFWRD